MYRKAEVWRGPITRAMCRHHWRYAVYLLLMGYDRFLPYRVWLWSYWKAHRELRRKRIP